MKLVSGLMCLVIVASLAVAQNGDKSGEPNKDVQVRVTFPKEATFQAADKPGGKVGVVTAKVEIKNTGDKGVVVSSAQFDVKASKPLMAVVPKLIDALLLAPGRSIT